MGIRTWIETSRFSFWLTYTFSRFVNFLVSFFLRKGAQVQKVKSLLHAQDRLADLKWSEDVVHFLCVPIKHPVMFSAEYVQYKINKSETPQTDCDEFAIYACALIESLPEVKEAVILTVRGTSRSGAVKGHNVCVFSYYDRVSQKTRYGHLGNWGTYTGYSSIHHVARAISILMGVRMRAYAIASRRLRMKFYERA